MDALELPLKGMLVEKPLGHTAAAGARIVEAIKKRQLPMVVPHNMLATAGGRAVIDRVRAGAIGELRTVEILSGKWDIMNAGIHWLNYFVNLTGLEPVSYVLALAESSTRTFRDGLQVETTAITCVETDSKVRAYMLTGDEVQSTLPDGKNGFRIVGTSGVIEIGAYAPAYDIRSADYPAGERITPAQQGSSGHQWHLESLADMIDSGSPDYTVADSSLAALELCEAAYISSKHRCKVTFPLEDFTPPPELDWEPGKPYSGHGGGRDGRKL
jgi:predicted dehydrogenase